MYFFGEWVPLVLGLGLFFVKTGLQGLESNFLEGGF